MDKRPTAPPPPEYKNGCKAADKAADELEASSDRAAQNIARRRKSGRWEPPVIKRHPQPSQPLLFRGGLVRVTGLGGLARKTPGRGEVGEPRRIHPPEHAAPLARPAGGVELGQSGLHVHAG